MPHIDNRPVIDNHFTFETSVGADDIHIDGGYTYTKVLGTSGNDVLDLTGQDFGNYLILGKDGDDTETGGVRADLLKGGGGDDTLNAGVGNGDDTLVGGKGADTFVFSGSPETFGDVYTKDTVVGYHSGDIVDLSAIDADWTQDGNQEFVLVKHFTGHPGEIMVSYDQKHHLTDLAMDLTGDGHADYHVELMGKHKEFAHADFAGLVL